MNKSSKERSKADKLKSKDNEESGELSSSSSDTSAASSRSASSDSRRKRRLSKKTSEKEDSTCTVTTSEEGELESGTEAKQHSKVPKDAAEPVSVRLQKTRKLIKKTEEDHERSKHKLAKIERALVKAQASQNKVNMRKCQKYKLKYGLKVDKFKETLKQLQVRKTKLIAESRGQAISQLKAAVETKPLQQTKRKTEAVAKEKPAEANAKRQRTSPVSQKSKPTDKAAEAALAKNAVEPVALAPAGAAVKSVLKLPFPVLNDKRNMKIILGTLESKRNELIKKRDQNLQNLKALTKRSEGDEKDNERIEKVKQLDQAFESQRDKIEKQVEYLRLALSLEVLRNRTAANPALILQNKHAIEQMSAQLNDMYNFMKQENMLHLQKQQEMADAAGAAAEEEAARKKAEEKLTTVFDQVNNSLAALIAHVAATAHAAAACVASSHFYSAYYPQAEGKIPVGMIEEPAPVPIKTQVATASTKFASLKDKISSFFSTMSRKEEDEPSGLARKSGLNLLISNYNEEEVEEEKMEEEARRKDVESDDESGSESELEIVTTSELKSESSPRNYLLPSLKASYFPLQASLSNGNPRKDLNTTRQAVKHFKDFLYQ